MNARPVGFWELARRLLSGIRGIVTAIQEQEKGMSPEISAPQKTKKERESIPSFVRAEVNIMEGVEVCKNATETNDERAYQSKTLRVNWLSFWVALATLASLIVYARITHSQLVEMRKATIAATNSAHAAKSAADTAQDALVRGQRPWVGVLGVPTIKGPVQMMGPNLAVDFVVTVKNYGPSPALHTRVLAGGFFPENIKSVDDLFRQWSDAADSVCEGAAVDLKQIYRLPSWNNLPPSVQLHPVSGSIVFPNDVVGTEIEVQTANKPEALNTVFDIVGCAAYGDQFGKAIHYTRFCYGSGGTAKQLSPSSKLHLCGFNQSAE
jgi:hypothetical protein